jgi:hypothetical protein
MKAIYFLDKDWQIGKLSKGGFGIFYKDKRCLDYMGQTGLGKRFATAADAAKALHACNFDVYEGM